MKKMIRPLLFLIAAAVTIPFLLGVLGIGGETFEQVGWVFPMLALGFGLPLIVVLLVLDAIIVKMSNKYDDEEM